MAEGIARALLPQGVRVWSAGSSPTKLRPEAVMVLREIGIDISGQRAKSVNKIPADEVDTVVTLCGGNVCPILPTEGRSLHWEIPDPADVKGPEEARLAAFRRARDELRQRIEELISKKLSGRPAGTT